MVFKGETTLLLDSRVCVLVLSLFQHDPHPFRHSSLVLRKKKYFVSEMLKVHEVPLKELVAGLSGECFFKPCTIFWR